MYMAILIDQVRNRSPPAPPMLRKKTDEATGFSDCIVNYVLLVKRMLDKFALNLQIKKYEESKEYVDVMLVTSKRSY